MSEFNYEEAALKSAQKNTSRVLKEIHANVPDSGLRLLYLIEKIPNWETYLTEKQSEAAKCYIRCLNACEVDYQLKLNVGTAQQRLFGSSTSKGAIGKLEEVIKRLEQQGFFDRQKAVAKKNEEMNQKKNDKKPVLSEKLKSDVRELLRLVIEHPDYEQYLTDSQKERMYQFMRLRSIKSCAKYFNVTEMTFKQSLFGRSGQGGILGRLKNVVSNKTVDSWDDI